MHPVLKCQHAWVNTSHSYQTFKHTGPQTFEFGCFRQHCWSQLHMIPDEDDMCVSAGQLERDDRERLCRLSNLVHQNELTCPGLVLGPYIARHLQGTNHSISVMGKCLALPLPPPLLRFFAIARRVPISCDGHFLGRDSSHVRIVDFARGPITLNV